MLDALVLRSENDLDNRFLPHKFTPVSEAYQLLALWFYPLSEP